MTGYPKGATWALGWLLTLTVLVGVKTPAVALDADHLILSEIVAETHPQFDTTGSSYIQVVNPTASDVDMGQVYITNGNLSGSAAYYNLTLGDPANFNPGGGAGGSFNARFPSGYILAAGDSLAISIAGSTEYLDRYGRLPDFELFEDAFVPDDVPELVEAFPGSVNAGSLVGGTNSPALGFSTGSLILYTWDGASDLVQDLDYLIWGTNNSLRVDKSGVTIGSQTYLNDTIAFSQEPVPGEGPILRHSLRRINADEGAETLSGGNGAGGHDETSENLATTWHDVNFMDEGHGVPAAPGTLFPAAPVFTAWAADPDDPYDGQEVVLSTTVRSGSDITAVTFHYSVDGGADLTLAGTNSADNDYIATLPAQVEGAVVAWYCTAENAAGGSSTFPVAAPLYTRNWTVAAAPLPGSGAEKLLITEVSVDPDELEYIEIYNPNSYSVDLSDYYLTDAIYYSSYGNQLYWQIAGITPTRGDVGGGNYNDFTARFPDGYSIEPGGIIVIAVQGSNGFNSHFGFLPDLELYEDGSSADEVPDFRPVFINPPDDDAGNSIYTPNRDAGNDGRPRGIPELEEYFGEPVILYHYAEGDDFVTDIDIVIWRHTIGDFPFTFSKTDVTIGSHSYLDDTPVDEQVSSPKQVGFGESYNRITSDRGFQPASDSNGVGGRNETGEDLATTVQVSAHSPGVYNELTINTSTKIELLIEAKTFIPTMGEIFHVDFITDPDVYDTKVRIFDLEGRLVITLYETHRDGASGLLNGLDWDGRDSVYERVRAGLYILHLSAVDKINGEVHTTTAPVVVAARLSK